MQYNDIAKSSYRSFLQYKHATISNLLPLFQYCLSMNVSGFLRFYCIQRRGKGKGAGSLCVCGKGGGGHSQVASFLWPLKTCSSSLRLRMSNSFIKWSLDAVSSQLPLAFHFTSITVNLWACLKKDRDIHHYIVCYMWMNVNLGC